jgi:hypothetical protein
MKPLQSTFVAAARVRQALVDDGDIRAEIAFQNDINAMLAGLEDGSSLPAEGNPVTPVIALQLSAETLAVKAAAARRVGLRNARTGPGAGRRPALGCEPATPYVYLETSVSLSRSA